MLSFFQHLFPYYVFRVHLAIVSARFERKKPPLKSILPVFGVAHAVWHAARGMYFGRECSFFQSRRTNLD